MELVWLTYPDYLAYRLEEGSASDGYAHRCARITNNSLRRRFFEATICCNHHGNSLENWESGAKKRRARFHRRSPVASARIGARAIDRRISLVSLVSLVCIARCVVFLVPIARSLIVHLVFA